MLEILASLTPIDYSHLARVVQAEASRNTFDEYCVAASVLNRVKSDKFPNTVSKVVYQSPSDSSIVIIDELSGSPMEGRRYGDGLHQAIEAKENLVVQKENQTLASVTYQNFFRTYSKLSGMTGTALTEAAEFELSLIHI